MSEAETNKREDVAQQVAAAPVDAAAPVAEGDAAAAPVKAGQPTAADLLKADLGDVVIRRAKGSKNITSGVVHILATFNNTKVAFTDKQGNVISWSSSGKCTSVVPANPQPMPPRW